MAKKQQSQKELKAAAAAIIGRFVEDIHEEAGLDMGTTYKGRTVEEWLMLVATDSSVMHDVFDANMIFQDILGPLPDEAADEAAFNTHVDHWNAVTANGLLELAAADTLIELSEGVGDPADNGNWAAGVLGRILKKHHTKR